LIEDLPEAFFARLLGACPRRARETLFGRFSIPKPKKKASALLPSKDPERIRKLQRALSALDASDEDGQQVGEELIRVYLMSRRGLLNTALDAIGITHDNGLTDADLDIFTQMDPDDVAILQKKLATDFEPADVDLYLRFMGAELRS
jgi:hypothetical protein